MGVNRNLNNKKTTQINKLNIRKAALKIVGSKGCKKRE